MRDPARRAAGRVTVVFSVSPSRTVRIAVMESGFEPERVLVGAGEVVAVIFTRVVEQAPDRVVISIDDGAEIERLLPPGVSVGVTLVVADAAGEIAFSSCRSEFIPVRSKNGDPRSSCRQS